MQHERGKQALFGMRKNTNNTTLTSSPATTKKEVLVERKPSAYE